MKWFLLLHFQFTVYTHFSILTNKEVVGAKVVFFKLLLLILLFCISGEISFDHGEHEQLHL